MKNIPEEIIDIDKGVANNDKGVSSLLLDKKQQDLLKKQQYYFIGNHSAVKICFWTKKSIRGEDTCYKEKFYGIRAHLCCQISISVSYCQNRCIFCWRDLSYTKGITMDNIPNGLLDEPDDIIRRSIIAQRKLLEGYGGYDKIDKKKFEESKNPMHYAISLTGEATLYPKLDEFIKKLHEQGKTTFLVSNGLANETFAKLEKENALPTQLYISIDAPNKELHRKIDNSQVDNAWERLMETLDFLKRVKDKTRTTLRITTIKGWNMTDVEGYSRIIQRSEPKFVEVKSYMWVGASRKRLDISNMPTHEETKEFALKIAKASGYKYIDEKKESRVVLLMKEDSEDRIMKF